MNPTVSWKLSPRRSNCLGNLLALDSQCKCRLGSGSTASYYPLGCEDGVEYQIMLIFLLPPTSKPSKGFAGTDRTPRASTTTLVWLCVIHHIIDLSDFLCAYIIVVKTQPSLVSVLQTLVIILPFIWVTRCQVFGPLWITFRCWENQDERRHRR